MDLVSLIAACAVDYDRATMHKLVALESGGEPYSYRVVGEGKNHTFDTAQAAIDAALAEQDSGSQLRLGLAGLQTDLRSDAAKPVEMLFQPCSNLLLAARQLSLTEANCEKTGEGVEGSPAYCAIARWHAPDLGEPDAAFAQNVLLYPESQLPNPTLAPAADGSGAAGSVAATTAQAAKPAPTPEPDPEDDWQPDAPTKAEQEVIDGGGALFFNQAAEIGVTDEGARRVFVEATETDPNESEEPEQTDEARGGDDSEEPAADPDGKDAKEPGGFIAANRVQDE